MFYLISSVIKCIKGVLPYIKLVNAFLRDNLLVHITKFFSSIVGYIVYLNSYLGYLVESYVEADEYEQHQYRIILLSICVLLYSISFPIPHHY